MCLTKKMVNNHVTTQYYAKCILYSVVELSQVVGFLAGRAHLGESGAGYPGINRVQQSCSVSPTLFQPSPARDRGLHPAVSCYVNAPVVLQWALLY